MYYILYEGLKIESNEPVYYTVYTIFNRLYSTLHCILYDVGEVLCIMMWVDDVGFY